VEGDRSRPGENTSTVLLKLKVLRFSEHSIAEETTESSFINSNGAIDRGAIQSLLQ
jgi:hypothetical protein